MPKAHTKKLKKYYGIYMVILSEGNLLNPFGVRRDPSEPASVFSVVKNPASNSHFTKPSSTVAFIAISYHLSPTGTVPQAITSKAIKPLRGNIHSERRGKILKKKMIQLITWVNFVKSLRNSITPFIKLSAIFR